MYYQNYFFRTKLKDQENQTIVIDARHIIDKEKLKHCLTFELDLATGKKTGMPKVRAVEYYVLLELLHCMAMIQEDEEVLFKFYTHAFENVAMTSEGPVVHDPYWIATYILLPAETISKLFETEYCRRAGFGLDDSNAVPARNRIKYDTKRKYIKFFINLILKHGLDMGMVDENVKQQLDNIRSKCEGFNQNQDIWRKVKPCGIMCILLLNFPCFIQEFLDQQHLFWKDYSNKIIANKANIGHAHTSTTADDFPWIVFDPQKEPYIYQDIFTCTEESQGSHQYQLFPITKTTGKLLDKRIQTKYVVPKMFQDFEFLTKIVTSGNLYPLYIKDMREGKEITEAPSKQITTVFRRCDGHPEYALKLLPKRDGTWDNRYDRNDTNYYTIKHENEVNYDSIYHPEKLKKPMGKETGTEDESVLEDENDSQGETEIDGTLALLSLGNQPQKRTTTTASAAPTTQKKKTKKKKKKRTTKKKKIQIDDEEEEDVDEQQDENDDDDEEEEADDDDNDDQSRVLGLTPAEELFDDSSDEENLTKKQRKEGNDQDDKDEDTESDSQKEISNQEQNEEDERKMPAKDLRSSSATKHIQGSTEEGDDNLDQDSEATAKARPSAQLQSNVARLPKAQTQPTSDDEGEEEETFPSMITSSRCVNKIVPYLTHLGKTIASLQHIKIWAASTLPFNGNAIIHEMQSKGTLAYSYNVFPKFKTYWFQIKRNELNYVQKTQALIKGIEDLETTLSHDLLKHQNFVLKPMIPNLNYPLPIPRNEILDGNIVEVGKIINDTVDKESKDPKIIMDSDKATQTTQLFDSMGNHLLNALQHSFCALNTGLTKPNFQEKLIDAIPHPHLKDKYKEAQDENERLKTALVQSQSSLTYIYDQYMMIRKMLKDSYNGKMDDDTFDTNVGLARTFINTNQPGLEDMKEIFQQYHESIFKSEESQARLEKFQSDQEHTSQDTTTSNTQEQTIQQEPQEPTIQQELQEPTIQQEPQVQKTPTEEHEIIPQQEDNTPTNDEHPNPKDPPQNPTIDTPNTETIQPQDKNDETKEDNEEENQEQTPKKRKASEIEGTPQENELTSPPSESSQPTNTETPSRRSKRPHKTPQRYST